MSNWRVELVCDGTGSGLARSDAMSDTKDPDALLTVCVQDLHAGEQLIRKRLPAVIRHVDDAPLRQLLEGIIETAGQRVAEFRDSGRDLEGPDNLWMAGIVDDAERDTDSVEAGPLLDIALIGAIRKACAARIVSFETAHALAERCDPALASTINAIIEADKNIDHRLRDRLLHLCETVKP